MKKAKKPEKRRRGEECRHCNAGCDKCLGPVEVHEPAPPLMAPAKKEMGRKEMGRKQTPPPSPHVCDVSKNRPGARLSKPAPSTHASTSAPAPSSGRAVQPPTNPAKKDVKKMDPKREERLPAPQAPPKEKQKLKAPSPKAPKVKQKAPKTQEARIQFGNDFPHLFLVKTPMK